MRPSRRQVAAAPLAQRIHSSFTALLCENRGWPAKRRASANVSRVIARAGRVAMNPSPRFLMAICIGLLLVGFCPRGVAGQSIVDRIKKAAEDAKKKGEAKPPATTPSGTTPAQPNGAGPATPATPAKEADGRPAALMDSSGVVSTAGT